jgi:hypothetical protein
MMAGLGIGAHKVKIKKATGSLLGCAMGARGVCEREPMALCNLSIEEIRGQGYSLLRVSLFFARENSSPLTPELLFLQHLIRNLSEHSIGDDTDFIRVKH